MRRAIGLAIFIAVFAAGFGSFSIAESSDPGVGEPGELVTLAEFCAFRAPLALTGAAPLPDACDEIVALLRRLAETDPACYEQWLEIGAMPPCAVPHTPPVP